MCRFCIVCCLTLLLPLMAATTPSAAAGAEVARLEFNRDVRPILSEACLHCHGPDKNQRQADLRLDDPADARRDRDGRAAVVPGQPEKSELIARITSRDPDLRMPPPEAERQLTPEQIKTLARWIAEGAEYQPHWSLIPPRRPPLPEVKDAAWCKNPVDRFVLAKLEQQGLRPSPEADPITLCRRLHLDLTGLPPTPAEVEAFVRSYSQPPRLLVSESLTDEDTGRLGDQETAYEALVDKLLASPRYGERMAVPWLDAARYADTNGYQDDSPRVMWRWRDWVIEAFNRNLPFDQFTIEQLAGDMLPAATLDQIIATGFNRNHRGNSEGGIIPEEFLVEYVVDRVDTTSTVWLGLTIGCARCHDHKYDPITQRDYYRLYAFFNSIPELGKVVRPGNSPPLVKSPTPEMQRQLAELEQAVAAAEKRSHEAQAQLVRDQQAWEQALDSRTFLDWTITAGLVTHFPLDGDARNAAAPAKTEEAAGGPTLAAPATFATGRLGGAVDLDGKRFVDGGDVGSFPDQRGFSYGAWVYPRRMDGVCVLARMDEDQQDAGYDLFLDGGKFQADLVSRLADDAIRVETVRRFAPRQWHHVLVTYDGSRTARGVKLYVDGKAEKLTVLSDTLSNPLKADAPLRIGARGESHLFDGLIDDVRIYDRVLPASEVSALAAAETINEIAAIPAASRTPPQSEKLRLYYLAEQAAPAIKQAFADLATARAAYKKFDDSIPTTMVMQELPQPRDAFVLVRGAYDKPGEKVTRGVPASLPPLPPDAPANRLGFARWLVDAGNPLTARVAVNRFWQLYFGTGIVKTTEDFGVQGEAPSHPELLDWLATEFIGQRWNVKLLVKTIVTSAAYRQSSRTTAALAARDPENRLLARGPRVRLSAEMVRDLALFASGLLVERVGGPSVKPYQPEGLWEELSNNIRYEQSHGADLYRRTMYTFFKRAVAPPSMMTFDASGREACVVRQARTNTPLQALALLNDVTYVEAARALAQRTMREGGGTAADRIGYAFRLATSRPPRADELAVLLRGYERHLGRYQQDRTAAEKLVRFGESPVVKELDPAELAALTTVAGVILNLDETITKE